MKTKVTVGNTIFSSKAETWEENSNQEKSNQQLELKFQCKIPAEKDLTVNQLSWS